MTQEFLIQNSWLIGLAVASGGLLLWPMITKGGASRVTVAQATLLMNQKKAVFVDIRDEDVVAQQGTVLHAKRIPQNDLKNKAAALSKSKETPVVVVCQTGVRASGAAKILKEAGYTEVHILDGGVNAWKEAGMPMKKPADDNKNAKAKAKA